MQSDYAEQFQRDMACTEADWLRWLPGAVGASEWTSGPGRATVRIGTGTLTLAWHAAEPRVIALMRFPRLQVSFRFEGLDAEERRVFMQRFDLYLQRGGG